MPDSGLNNSLKRLRSNYRLIILNEDTYEEVVKFKLTRVGVYAVFSLAFILLTGLTAALIIFTPLKYYIPGMGMGDVKQIKEYRELKLRTDSLERTLAHQDNYLKNIQNVLQGNIVSKDTATLNLNKAAKRETRKRR